MKDQVAAFSKSKLCNDLTRDGIAAGIFYDIDNVGQILKTDDVGLNYALLLCSFIVHEAGEHITVEFRGMNYAPFEEFDEIKDSIDRVFIDNGCEVRERGVGAHASCARRTPEGVWYHIDSENLASQLPLRSDQFRGDGCIMGFLTGFASEKLFVRKNA